MSARPNILLFSGILFLGASCSAIYYANDPVITSNVKKEGDFNLSVGANISSYASGFHMNVSKAASKNVFFSGSLTAYNGKITSSGSFNTIAHYGGFSLNAGGGYYTLINENTSFQVLIGYARGANLNNINSSITDVYRNKYYSQPSLVYAGKNFQAGFGIRCGMVDFTKIESSDKSVQNQKMPSLLVIEPGINFCGGGEIGKIGIQISRSFANLSNIPIFGPSYDPLSVCIFFRITFPNYRNEKTN